jgi:hypothetical protein
MTRQGQRAEGRGLLHLYAEGAHVRRGNEGAHGQGGHYVGVREQLGRADGLAVGPV